MKLDLTRRRNLHLTSSNRDATKLVMIFDVGYPNGMYRVTELNYDEDCCDIIDSLHLLDTKIDSTMNTTLIKVKCYWNEMLKRHNNVYLVYFYTTKGKVDIPFSKMRINTETSSSYDSNSYGEESSESEEELIYYHMLED